MTDSRTPDDVEPSTPADAPAPPRRAASAADRMTGAAGTSEPRGQVAGASWRLALLLGGVAALGLLAGRGWLLIIGALFVMVFLHELGHFLTAKWAGMKVTEFFIGIGPKVWSFRRGETEYGIKLVPLVAYVRIIGMNNVDEVAPEDEPRTYRQQSYPKRLLVVSAGSLMHVLQAFVLFVVVFGIVGVSADTELAQRLGGQELDETTWVVGNVVEDSAAEQAGLRVGDDLRSIDGQPVERFADVGPIVGDRVGDEVALVVERDGRVLELHTEIGRRTDDRQTGFLGIGDAYPQLPAVTANPIEAVSEAGSITVSFLGQTVQGMASFFTGIGDFASTVVDSGSDGPVMGSGSEGGGGQRVEGGAAENRVISIYGVARIGASVSEDGMSEFLILLALVNISIGVLNMVPLLPLDGGHVAVATYERIRSIRGRRHMADVSRLLPLTYAVFIFLIMLMTSTIYLDIVDPVGVG